MIQHRIILDVSKTGLQKVLQVNQTEFSSREIIISLRNDSEAVDLSGCSAAFVMTMPDGTVTRPLSCICYGDESIYSNSIVVTLNSTMTSQVGIVHCRVIIASAEDSVMYTPSFAVQVASVPAIVESIEDEGSTTAEEFLAITQAKLEAQGWATGSMGDGSHPSSLNNSKYYSDKSKEYSEASDASAQASASSAASSASSATLASNQVVLAQGKVEEAQGYSNQASGYLDQVKFNADESKRFSEASQAYSVASNEKANASAQSALESKGYKEYIESYIANTPPVIGANGNWLIYNGTSYIDTGKSSIGKPFTIKKTYSSVEEMNRGFASDEVLEGEFVCIATGNVEDPDDAKLYVKGAYSYRYITDLSGAQGIKGDMGTVNVGITETVAPNAPAKVTNVGTPSSAVLNFQIPQGVKGERGYGITSVELISGDHSQGTKDTYRMTFENGYTFDYEVYNGANGEVQRSEFDTLSNSVNQHSEAIVELENTKADKSEVSSVEKRVDNLEFLVHKEDYVENDSGTAYVKDVPTNTAPNNVLNILGANPQKDMTKTARASVLGNTLKYNQQVNSNFTKTYESQYYPQDNVCDVNIKNNHIYGVLWTTSNAITSATRYGLALNEGSNMIAGNYALSGSYVNAGTHLMTINAPKDLNGAKLVLWVHTPNTAVTVSKVMFVDLTEMGYTSSPTVSEFLAKYPAYNSFVDRTDGTLSAPIVEEVTYCGDNLLQTLSGYNTYGGATDDAIVRQQNGVIGIAKVKPNTTYKIYDSSRFNEFRYFLFDNNPLEGNISTDGAFGVATMDSPITTTESTHYLVCRLSNTNKYDGKAYIVEGTSGIYSPYMEQKVTFSQPHILNGLSNSKDEAYSYVDNGYLVTKKITRYGEVDLGTKTWTKYTNAQYPDRWLFVADIADGKVIARNESVEYTVSKYSTYGSGLVGADMLGLRLDKTAFYNAAVPRLVIEDSSIADENAFTTAMNGVYAVYPLDTPTITEISRIPLTMDFEQTSNILADAETEVQKGVVKAPMVEKVRSIGRNRFYGWMAGEININNGIYRYGTDGIVTDFIDVHDLFLSDGTDVDYRTFNRGSYSITLRCYDIDKNYLGANITSDTYYIRFRFLNAYSAIDTLTLNVGQGAKLSTEYWGIGMTQTFMLTDKLTAIESKLNSLGTSLKYGDLDLSGKKFVANYSSIDMGSINYTVDGDKEGLYYSSNAFLPNYSSVASTKMLCSLYRSASFIDVYNNNASNDLCIAQTNGNNNRLYVLDKTVGSRTLLASKLQGVKLIYPLRTTQTIDLSDILTDDDVWLPTEPNGTVTFVNADKLPIKYDIDWLKLGGTQ